MTTPQAGPNLLKAEPKNQTPRAILAFAPYPSTGEFLEELFSQLKREGIVYAVMRNYEGLPEKPGRDIDLLTTGFSQLVAVLKDSSRQAGYSLRIFRRYDGMVKFHLVRWRQEGLEVLEIDVQWSIRCKGITLVSPNLLPTFRVLKGVFFILRPGAEAAISLTKELMYHGAVPAKYKPQLAAMARSDREGFITALKECFGDGLVTKLFDLTCQSDWQGIEALVPQLRGNAILRAIKHAPFGQMCRWLSFLRWNLMKFFRPSGRFVVLIGPDGSGKSTISKKLERYLQPLFQGSCYFHGHFMIIPRLRDLAKLLGFKPSEEIAATNPDSGGFGERMIKFGILRSMLYLTYYSLGYLLGYGVIFLRRGRGELIIFDRYYYDYLIQPGMSLPSGLIMMVSNLLPKPDLLIYLHNDPQVIFSRKPELTIKELVRQSAVCYQLIDRLPQGCLVETTGTPEEITERVAKILIDKMFAGGKESFSNPTLP
jgi:thymidylate kinase